MKQLHSYLQGSWKPGIGDDISLLDPTTEGAVAVCKKADSLADAVAWGRTTGGPALRAMTFAERGALLGDMLVHRAAVHCKRLPRRACESIDCRTSPPWRSAPEDPGAGRSEHTNAELALDEPAARRRRGRRG